MVTETPSCILLTGVTGFLGKVVLEELIRRRHEYTLDKILVLLRPSKGKSAQQRFHQEVAQSKCFEKLPAKWIGYVEVVEGDLTQPKCGLDEQWYPLICAETTHIINCAACVAFDLPLADAAKSNVSTALNLITLAKCCPRLQGMVTTSTAYVAAHTPGSIRPMLAPLPQPAEILYERILAGQIDETALLRQTRYPNTYTLTKCLAEHMFLRHRGNVPLTIVRPSIISCSLKYPSPGWIDSKAAVAGFIALMGMGYLRVVDGREDAVLDVVPVDVVANDIIDEARLIPSPPPPYANNVCQIRANEDPIVHSVAGITNGLLIGHIASRTTAYFQNLHIDKQHHKDKLDTKPPATEARRTPKLTYLGRRNVTFYLHNLRDHRLPLSLAALLFQVKGDERMKHKTRSLAKVLKKINAIFPYYTHRTFEFEMGRKWSDSVGAGIINVGEEEGEASDGGSQFREEKAEDVSTGDYLGIILEGVRTNLLNM